MLEDEVLLLREVFLPLSESIPQPLREAVFSTLELEGQMFSPLPSSTHIPNGVWGKCTKLVAIHCNPSIDRRIALQAGLAVELAACGIDVQDDLIDGDSTPILARIGREQSLLVASALFLLSQQTLSFLPNPGFSLGELHRCLLATLSGQLRDLQGEGQELTVQEAIALACAKAVPLMQLAFHIGVGIAGVSRGQLAPFTELATNLGMAHQLSNDCHDLTKSDLTRGKGTLPLVLARQQQRATASISTDPSNQALRTGLEIAWGIHLLYQERVRSCIERLEPMSSELRMLLTGEPHA